MQSENPTLALVRRLMNPILIVLVLLGSLAYHEESMDGYYLVLAVISFFLASYLFDDLSISQPANGALWRGFGAVLLAWGLTVGGVILLGILSRLLHHYYLPAMETWFFASPVALFLAHLGLRAYVRNLHKSGAVRRAVIVGGNPVGERLARRLTGNQDLLTDFVGYFDDRRPDRLHPDCQARYLGHTHDLMYYISKNNVEVVYIALPISQKERISALLNTLKDTTASVYLVPDIFTFDLIQARIDRIGSVPIIAILETPFTSLNAFKKRLADIILSLVILTLISPAMLLIALGVKLSSKGPVIFKQRRYGLNGEEILVYKFRSMRVCEDGAQIRQATQNDDRITPLGRILRKTSLDELPQFINVLQGRMSIVGPRPHAVAHNELYRKQISGYMLRHKVKPGITGWAQVNGYRGETETVDKMASRVQYDLDYLRNWTLSLDIIIILKTVWLVFKDAKAY
jgi:putative colanic acid biosysnthesis UDP-glucose lipid carrier transferase